MPWPILSWHTCVCKSKRPTIPWSHSFSEAGWDAQGRHGPDNARQQPAIALGNNAQLKRLKPEISAHWVVVVVVVVTIGTIAELPEIPLIGVLMTAASVEISNENTTISPTPPTIAPRDFTSHICERLTPAGLPGAKGPMSAAYALEATKHAIKITLSLRIRHPIFARSSWLLSSASHA